LRARRVPHVIPREKIMLRSLIRKTWLPVLLVPALVMLMGFRQVPLVDPQPIPVPANSSQAKVKQVVGMALSARGWRITKDVPGEIDAVYDPRDFSVTIAVHYNARQIQINYVTSNNLRYEVKHGVRYIHTNYASWIKNLVTDISNGLMLAK
jgi:hypothetical protein